MDVHAACLKLAEFRITHCNRTHHEAKTITKEGLHLHPLIASLPSLKKKKNKQSLHLSTNTGEAHYYVHLLNI